FIDGKRCSYCNPSGNNPKVHFKDSFGYNHFDKVISWHKDNIISPFKISPNSHRKIKFICHECGNIFEKQLKDVHRGQWCVVCSKSKGEKVIETWLIKNNIKYNYEEKFKNLIGLSGGSLSYDFYLQEYKLLIEYQGEFHDGSLLEVCQTEEQYKQQQEHDRRKREYAKNNGYKLLEIWYWNFDNIEEILDKEIGSLL
ncbi:zinc-ribbon domain-containing protein, partial [Clostridioides difficile]